jgi:hypothetical protein
MTQVKETSTSVQRTEPDDDSLNGHEIIAGSFIEVSMIWLKARCIHRLRDYFGKAQEPFVTAPPVPLEEDKTPMAEFIRSCPVSADEFTILLLALSPHILPGFMDDLIRELVPSGGDIPEMGGVRGQHHRGMLPTGETALFILAGADINKRIAAMHLFDSGRFLVYHKMISLDTVSAGEPSWSGRLLLDQEFAEVFITGQVELPKLSMRFPAEHISTSMEWDDLILVEQVWEQINEIETWVKYHHILMQEWGMHRRLKPGYRVLFYGPPGTGKTLTTALLGKYTNRPVFRIDLSMVVSKFIGETEKNLASLFDKAEHKDWILFFDEADAIFSKRTGVRDAHDKYANQEVSYLLQRIESHSGLSILASNFRNNIDQAFIRRFNAIVYFPVPGYDERLQLWRQGFPAKAPLAKEVDFSVLAAEYELTGAQIMNIVQYACLCSLAYNDKPISMKDIEAAVHRENAKEGK